MSVLFWRSYSFTDTRGQTCHVRWSMRSCLNAWTEYFTPEPRRKHSDDHTRPDTFNKLTTERGRLVQILGGSVLRAYIRGPSKRAVLTILLRNFNTYLS